jgi:hypothetical protein
MKGTSVKQLHERCRTVVLIAAPVVVAVMTMVANGPLASSVAARRRRGETVGPDQTGPTDRLDRLGHGAPAGEQHHLRVDATA